MASTASAEDCGSGGGVAVKHGTAGKGPVVGLVQVCMVDDDIVAMNRPGHAPAEKRERHLGKIVSSFFRCSPHLRTCLRLAAYTNW